MPAKQADVNDGSDSWACVGYFGVRCHCPGKDTGACGLGEQMPDNPRCCLKCKEETTETLLEGYCSECLRRHPSVQVAVSRVCQDRGYEPGVSRNVTP